MTRLTFSTDNGIVHSSAGNIKTSTKDLGEYFQSINSKIPNLGLLPPVVRVITPLMDNDLFYVLVENTPRKQTILVEIYNEYGYKKIHSYELTLPWHSFNFNFHLDQRKGIITLRSVSLWFHSTQINTELDLVHTFFKAPYIPNTYQYGDICLSDDVTNLSGFCYNFENLYNLFLEDYWGTCFNEDLIPYWYYNDIMGNATDIVDAVLKSKEGISFEEACKNLVDTTYVFQTFPLNHSCLNSPIKFNDLLKGFT